MATKDIWLRHYVEVYCKKFLAFASEDNPSARLEEELDSRFFSLDNEAQALANKIIGGLVPLKGFCARTRLGMSKKSFVNTCPIVLPLNKDHEVDRV